jgi:hypothetical protein
LALMTPVMTSTEGRWVARMRWIPEPLAIGRSEPGFLHIALGHHHEIRQFVNNDHHVWQLRELEALLSICWL